jgi:hypothetical protein
VNRSSIPDVLNAYEGEPLSLLAIADTQGLSIVGGKVGLLTDIPGIYIHDDGGIFGTERLLRMAPLEKKEGGLHYSRRNDSINGYAVFGPEISVCFSALSKAGRVYKQLPPLDPNADFSTAMEVTVRCEFDAGALEKRDDMPVTPDGLSMEWHWLYPPHDRSAETMALSEHVTLQGELYAHVVVRNGRLTLMKYGEVLADLPVSALSVKKSKANSLRINTSVSVAGVATDGFEICFPPGDAAEALHAALSEASAQAPSKEAAYEGATAMAGAEVRGDGIDGHADLILGETGLRIEADGGKEVRSFDFGDKKFHIAGTNAAFVLGTVEGELMRVAIDSGSLRDRIQHASGVRDAARRTLESGPWPVLIDDAPAWVGASGETKYFIRGSGIDTNGVASKAKMALSFENGYGTLEIKAGRKLHTVTAERATLAAVYGMIRTQALSEQKAEPEQIVRLGVGLEGHYLDYTLFGPVLELHRVLLDQVGDSSGTDRLEAPADNQAAVTLASTMAAGVSELLRHFNRVLYSLPSFLVNVDAGLLGKESASQARMNLEMRRYRTVLSSLRVPLAELNWTHEMLTRIDAVQGNVRGASYAGAAISLVGALVNPIFLLPAAAQAAAASSGATSQQDAVDRATRDSIERVMQRWNEFIHVQLPGVAHQVLDGLFPLRWTTAREVVGALEKSKGKRATELRKRLNGRAAALETFLRFPEAGNTHARAEAVEASKSLRQELATAAPFQSF